MLAAVPAISLSIKPVTNMAELEGLPMRVMGAPIQTRIFEAIKAAPSVIAYSEVYSAIQTGVIDAAENEAAGIEQMKFYEVGPEISLDAARYHGSPLGLRQCHLRAVSTKPSSNVCWMRARPLASSRVTLRAVRMPTSSPKWKATGC